MTLPTTLKRENAEFIVALTSPKGIGSSSWKCPEGTNLLGLEVFDTSDFLGSQCMGDDELRAFSP